MIIRHFNRKPDDQDTLRDLARLGSRNVDRSFENALRGIAGERSVARHINRTFAGSENMAVLHDVSITVENVEAQIDHLLISRTLAKAWVFETKNLAGRLGMSTDGDWHVDYDKKRVPISSPVMQAAEAAEMLQRWFRINGILEIKTVDWYLIVPAEAEIDRASLPKACPILKTDKISRWIDDQTNELTLFEALYVVIRLLAKRFPKERLAAIANIVDAETRRIRSGRTSTVLLDEVKTIQSRSQPTKAEQDRRSYTSRRPVDGVPIQVRFIRDEWRANDYGQNPEVSRKLAIAISDISQWNQESKSWIIAHGDVEDACSRIKMIFR